MNIRINDLEITAEPGITILEAARRAEIDIPTLCSAGEDESHIPCGLCVVEIEGQDQEVRACTTVIEQGMVITTDSAKLKAQRREKLAVLAATHFGDCKAPCNLTCPGQINVQGYIAHVAKGQYEEALRLVMERNPFPFSVGRVCPRFCETRCRRLLVDEAVSINHLKRFVADWCMANKIDLKISREPATGKKIAIIGGGPAGLTAAYYLTVKGHDVTVFEAAPKLGGMLRYGLPEYKIPKDVLDYEINTILRLGINVRLSQKWGVDYTLQDLQDQGFDATLIAIGTPEDKSLDIPGHTLPGIYGAIAFLKEVNEGGGRSYGKRAAVIGGNNVAMEAARSLMRSGVEEVTVIYPRPTIEMPANQRNIREAEREGVQFLTMASPTTITSVPRGLEVQLTRMKLGEADARGIRQAEPIPGATNVLPVDTVVTSVGQVATSRGFGDDELEVRIELSPNGTLNANPRTSMTNLEGIFAAGDAASGPRSVIQAVVSARRAAENIHAHIMGEAKAAAESRFNFTRGKSFDAVDLRNFEGIRVKLREKMPERPPETAVQDFDEVKLGFSRKMAEKEAARCLSCGCNAFDRCELKTLSIDHDINLNKTGMGTVPAYSVERSHPAMTVDLNKCIYCRNCVASCEYDALDLSATGFDDQGRAVGISLTFNEKCVSCGKCVDNCSTGALNKKDQIVPIINEAVRNIRTTCPYCGTGCQVLLKVKGNTIMEVSADPDTKPNYGNLCVKGRFGLSFVHHPDRLTTPLIRRKKGAPLEPVGWEEALDYITGSFHRIRAEKGPDAFAGLASARCTSEENYLFQKFFRTQIGTNNVDHCARY